MYPFQRAFSCILLLILCGCGSAPQSQTQIQSFNECPDKPEGSLGRENVKTISLENQPVKESGMAKAGKSVGYAFNAKSGQKFSYRTSDSICIWVYAPDNQLLTTKDLPQTGRYTLQIAALKGSGTFEVELGLDVNQSVPSMAAKKLDVAEPTDFVINHYLNLQNRQYNDTWQKLSPNFQGLAGGFSSYAQWWDSVKAINIGDVQLIERNTARAIVNAQLQYVMNDGGVFNDPKSRIELVWNSQSNGWLFERKSEP